MKQVNTLRNGASVDEEYSRVDTSAIVVTFIRSIYVNFSKR